jgi:hypothetical protein
MRLAVLLTEEETLVLEIGKANPEYNRVCERLRRLCNEFSIQDDTPIIGIDDGEIVNTGLDITLLG